MARGKSNSKKIRKQLVKIKNKMIKNKLLDKT